MPWKKALLISIGITLLGLPLGIIVGCGIALLERNWPYIVYGYGPYENSFPPCIMIGISNAILFSTVIGAAFHLAVGVAQIGTIAANKHPLTNNQSMEIKKSYP